jgi:hypothetical protein
MAPAGLLKKARAEFELRLRPGAAKRPDEQKQQNDD